LAHFGRGTGLAQLAAVRDPARFRSITDAGFTMLELLVVLVLAGTVMAIFAGFYPIAAATMQGDADMRILSWQLKQARETAVNQRRPVQLQFLPPNGVQIVRLNIPNGTTVLETAVFEHNSQFLLFAGQPDTPDGFGRTGPISFGGAATVMFTADGMLTDGAGNPINGTIFLGQPGRPMTARALTIFGPTAMIRGYRWNGSAWSR
jgi:prepilin-type N-terminal cleavage/methylation domain-containing protein